MADFSSNVTPADLVDAFIHPPTLVEVAARAESDTGEVLIVSHLELWPWRVVVRGVRADRYADTSPTVLPVPPDLSATARTVLVEAVRADRSRPDALARRQAHAAWYTSWQIADDIATDFQRVGAGGGGSGGNLWSDFRVEFHPSVPPAARQLTITSPYGDEIAVRLPE